MAVPSVRKKKSFAQSSKPAVRMCVLDHRDDMRMSSPELVWPVPMRAIGAQNLLTMPGGVSTAGYLHKKGGSQFSLMKWPLRYIIIHKGCVYYFKSSTSATPQGAFSLNGYNRVMRAAEETTSSNVFPFKIVHFSKRHRTWIFSAASEEERRSWMRYLRREINHYNDRQDSHIPSSDTDSDADSFYGTIERPMDIKHHIDNTDDDYVEEDDDDDDDEEDYLKPDSDCSHTHTGRPTGPPPSYPPPPVPPCAVSNHLRPDTKGLHPPLPLPLNRIPTSPLLKKPPPPAIPPLLSHKGPPPALPFTPHLQRTANFSPPTPPLPPPNPKRTPQSRAALVVFRDRQNPTASAKPPPLLPLCDRLESRLNLNGPTHSLLLGNNSNKVHHPPKVGPPESTANPKPPPPTSIPPLPSAKKPTITSPLQRASPDGQSFRSSGDEVPADFRKQWDSAKHNGDQSDDDDDDYENVQLPDSVFIDSTETSFVEKLFKESCDSPEDGLYAIRNSGTKTSKVLVVWDISLNKARNYRLFEENECMYLDCEVTFPCLATLIEHYHSHPLPHHGSLCLQKPYTKTTLPRTPEQDHLTQNH